MAKQIKKKAAKKRPYNRKPILVEPEPVEQEKDLEIELLATICSVIDNMDEKQKYRNMQFLFSKYGRYLDPFKVI